MLGLLAVAGIAGALTAALLTRGEGSGRASYPDPRPAYLGVPFAVGDPRPLWPILTKRPRLVSYRDIDGKIHGNAARRFMAHRDNGRYHVGIDLYANAGEVVVAPESGVVVNTQEFLESVPGEDALVIRGDSGVTYLLGELTTKSWLTFGVDDGSRVVKGQKVGRVALNNVGGHMLHFETYSCCPTRNEKWYRGKPKPPHLLDPTDYLLRAAQSGRVA